MFFAAGATSMAERVARQELGTGADCPSCSAPKENEDHALWSCPEWALAQGPWIPWVESSAQALPRLGAPTTWPPCLGRAGLLPLVMTDDADRDDVFDLARRLFGMYLAVLVSTMEKG